MEITRGKIGGALKLVVYGPEGIGKTTFASKFPGAVFIDTEGSTKFMDVARTPSPGTWAMLMEQVKYFRDHPKECGTLVIDTLDWAEQLCKTKVCADYQKKGIEDFGYGKGYVYLQEDVGRLLNVLEEVVRNGTYVVLNCHAKMRKFEQPDELGAYDRWELKLEKTVAPLVKEWADIILFANYKTYVINVDDQGAVKGKNKAQGGKRVMYTTHHACWDAKNRHGLKEELPFDFAEIANLIQAPSSPATVPSSPPPPPLHAPAPVQAPASEPEMPAETPSRLTELPDKPLEEGDRTGIPRGLLQLMDDAKIFPCEVEAIVASKHIFPPDMKIKDMPMDYINGVLIGAWEQVRKAIEDDPDRLPF
ncbi:MAG: ATP-binding protein [Oscillospiraceae bacterium]